ncbi:MAG: paraslipin [Candidatus Schekmanbacteria bacterium]|nr:paraslipin [Candidatus Schekmanbacteria bacterium]
MELIFTVVTILFFAMLVVVRMTFIVVPMRETVIKERLGKFAGVLEPGFHFLTPIIERVAYRHEMREQVIDIPSQSCITRDNIQVDVDGIVYMRVMDGSKASYGIEDYRRATINLAQTTMRAEIGKLALDQTFVEREAINEKIVQEIDKASSPWGIKMIRYEIMNITPSRRVIETMEKQMEAERHKRADITLSTGHKEAKINMSEGERQEAVNLSEGQKQRRINEAHGRAEEIRILAEASAEGIRGVAAAIRRPAGNVAVRMQLVEQFIEEFGRIVGNSNVTVVPEDLANLRGFFQGLSQIPAGVPSRD